MTRSIAPTVLVASVSLGAAGCTKLLGASTASFAPPDGGAQETSARADAGAMPESSSSPVECDFVDDPVYLKAADPRTSAWFGTKLALNHNRLVVLAPLERDTPPASETLDPNASCPDRGPPDMDVVGAGATHAFERALGWSEQKLVPAGSAHNHPLVPKDSFQPSILRLANLATSSLAVSDDWVVMGVGGDSGVGPFRGSVRLFRRPVPNGSWLEESGAIRSLSQDAGDNDLFGAAVALSGSTLVVGAPSEDSGGLMDSGAAYVYELMPSGPSPIQRIVSPTPSKSGWFGASIAVSGDWLAVGAPGEYGLGDAGAYYGTVQVYRRAAAQFESAGTLIASGMGIEGYFGSAVALSGDQIAVSAPGIVCPRHGANFGGSVFLFSALTGWQDPQCIDAIDSPATVFFGFSIAMSANALVVGAPISSGSASGFAPDIPSGPFFDSSGSVYAYRLSGGSPQEPGCRVKAPNTGPCDDFGEWVALADDYFAVGAPFEDGRQGGIGPPDEQNFLMDSGGVYIYTIRAGPP